MKDYSYDLPQELIALEPAVPRDSSKLLIYNTKDDSVVFDIFANISNYIPAKSLMVLNSTRVLPSRIMMRKKSTNGKIVVLVLLNEKNTKGTVFIILDRKANSGEILALDGREIFEVISQKEGGIFEAKILITESDLIDLLEQKGNMPIPLYLRKTKLTNSELGEKYQTVFAKITDPKTAKGSENPLGSVAAPTASLHFTEEVFKRLKEKNVHTAKVNLEVGLGTFAPINSENLSKGVLHKEWFSIEKEEKCKIIEAKDNRLGILACGTTVVRALESWGGTEESVEGEKYVSTNIFIRPGHNFQMVDMLLTNFHLPNSSLMMLVEAFLQSKNASKSLKNLYQIAIERRFRFFSFGDAMLII